MENFTLIDFYSYFITMQGKLIGKTITSGTFRTYNVRFNNLKKFLLDTNRLEMKPVEVKIKFIREFDIWLRAEKKCGNDYVMKNIQLLQTIMNLCLEYEVIPYNPLALYRYKYERLQKKVYLTKGELIRLKNFQSNSKKLNRAKDVFVFCCYTGLSYIDVKTFNPKVHIKPGPDGSDWIYLKRTKSKADSYIPLLQPAAELLGKYPKRLPVICNQHFNKYLKVIAKSCMIKKELTSHAARKTFGNLLHNHYDVPIETVSRMLGHKSIKTTQSWYVETSLKRIMLDMTGVKEMLRNAG
jgi:integrase